MIIETPKDESAFIYCVFESNEGLCFYSTIGEILGHPDRKLLVHSPVSINAEFEQMMSYLIKKVPTLKILEDQIVTDSFDLENTSLKRKNQSEKFNEQK
jgi:hypothetical protein